MFFMFGEIKCTCFILHMLINRIPCVIHCSFTVHTGAGLIVPEIVDDGKVCSCYTICIFELI